MLKNEIFHLFDVALSRMFVWIVLMSVQYSLLAQASLPDSLRQLIRPEMTGEEAYKAYNDIGVWYRYQHAYDSTVAYYQKIIDLGEDKLPRVTILETGLRKAMMQVRANDMEGFEGTLLWTADQAEAWEEDSMKAFALHYLAESYMTRGEQDKAMEYAFAAREIADRTGGDMLRAFNYSNIGSLFFRQKEYDRAIEFIRESLVYYRKMGMSTRAVIPLNNLSSVYQETEQWDSSMYYLKWALRIYENASIKSGMPTLYTNLAQAYEALDLKDSAIWAYDQALGYALEANNLSQLDYVYLKMGELNMAEGKYSEALALMDKVLEIGRQTDDLRSISNAQKNRWIIFRELGNFREAVSALEEHMTMKDSLLSLDKLATLEELQTKYETEENERKIAEQALDIARSRNERNLTILIGAILLLMAGGAFLYWRGRARNRRRETELQLQIKAAEAESLRELDTLKSRFFANISHEFRTPLTLILGPLQQMIDGTLQGSPGTYLSMMKRNGERLLQLINQLLDLSRLESGRMQVQLSRGNLVGFLRTLAAQFESLAESKNIRFHVHLPDQAIDTAFDQDKVEKVVSNLLSNAFKFTPEEGDVWLRVQQTGNSLELVIEDNGIGMSEEQLGQVFDRFYRVESGQFEGTGIGLALVQELTALINGTISVSSEAGKGSVFMLTLPLSQPEEAEQMAGQPQVPASLTGWAAEPAPVKEPVAGDKPLLLLVEDNPDVRTLLGGMLATDYDIRMAPDGIAGLELARELVPDLIISDVMMPGMDGNQLTHQLKSDELTSHIPVIQLTARAGQEAKLEGLGLGADDFIAKPFDERELKLKISNMLEQQERLRKKFGRDVVQLGPSRVEVNSADQAFLQRLISTIEEFMQDETFSIEDLGREIGLSRSQLHRKIKGLTDQSPSVFLRSIRLQRAKQLLEQQAGTAAEISYLVGFGSPAYFSKCFKDEYGVSPGKVKSAE